MPDKEMFRLLTTEEYSFLKTNPHLGSRIALLTLGGSHAYGTNVEGSDVDIRGFALNSIEDLLGSSSFEVFTDDATDTTIYGFNKVIELLSSCNPNVIEMLGCKPEHYLFLSEEGKMLLDNKELFLSKRAIHSFGGYARQQLNRLENAIARDKLSREAQENHILRSMENVVESFERRYSSFGEGGIRLSIIPSQKEGLEVETAVDISLSKYPARELTGLLGELANVAKCYKQLNTRNKKKDDAHLNKHAMHLVRLYLMALDILEKREINTYRENDRDFLLSIRAGKYQNPDGTYKPEFFEFIKGLGNRLDYAKENTDLPEKPDFKRIEELKIEINRRSLSLSQDERRVITNPPISYDKSVPPEVKVLLNRLHRLGYDAYAVGGCVRDILLGREPKDWDICTSATPEQVRACFFANKVLDTGLKHGTVTVMVEGTPFEVTTFRADGDYSDGRHPDKVSFVSDVSKDLARRDITINAMALDENGLVNLHGGLEDLKAGLVRCVGDPDQRFKEDGLRILRAMRFASVYGFEIEPKTKDAIHRNKELLRNVSSERIYGELCKILQGKGCLSVLDEFKDVVGLIIPELTLCVGFVQNNPYHCYDVYQHTLHAVSEYTGDDLAVKWALFLHDIGKPLCYTEDERGGHFYKHAAYSYQIGLDVLGRLKVDTATKNAVLDLVMFHDIELFPTERFVKRSLNKMGEERFRQLLAVKQADIKAQSGLDREDRLGICKDVEVLLDKVLEEKQCFSLRDLKIDGNDLLEMGIPEGPVIGQILKGLLDKVIDGTLSNDNDSLTADAQEYFNEEREI